MKVDAVVLAGAPNVNVELGAAAEVVVGAPKAGGAEVFVVPKAGGALVVAGAPKAGAVELRDPKVGADVVAAVVFEPKLNVDVVAVVVLV